MHVRWCGGLAPESWSRLETVGVTQLLIQKISIDVQRGNAAAVGQSLLLCPQIVDEFVCDDFVIAALTIFRLC